MFACGLAGALTTVSGAPPGAMCLRFGSPSYGGKVVIETGSGSISSSGSFAIQSVDAGTLGESGTLYFKSGTTSSGDSGNIAINTGNAVVGVVENQTKFLWP